MRFCLRGICLIGLWEAVLMGLCLLALLQYIVYRFVKKKKDRVIEQQRVAHQAELERQEKEDYRVGKGTA